MGATKRNVDFTNVKEGGNFSKKHMLSGDYLAKVTKVEDAVPKDEDDNTPMWLYTMQLAKTPSATYPYYCKLQDNQLWKVRNLLVAAGKNVPKKKVGVDPNAVVGKMVAVSLDDTEYNGKEQSEITAVFSPSELENVEEADPDDVDDVDDEDEDEEEVAPPPAKKKKAKPVVVEEEEEEEEEDEEPEGDKFDAMDRAELRRVARKAQPGLKVTKAMSDDDLRAIARGDSDEEEEEEEEEEPAPKAKKKKGKKAKKVVDEEDEDEIDIEDL